MVRLLAVKFFLLILLLSGTTNDLKAQFTRSTISMYQFNTLPINPAYAGSQMVSSLDLTYFGSQSEFQLLNRTSELSLHGPLTLDGVSNLGLFFKFVKEGAINEIRFRPSYTHRIDTEYGKLAIGVVLGINYFDVDENITPFFYQNFFSFDAGVGLYFHNKSFFAGISSLNIIENLLQEENAVQGLVLPRENPYFLHMGGVVHINDLIKLKPVVLGKYSDNYELTDVDQTLSNELGFDISASLVFEENYWVTLFYGGSTYEDTGNFLGGSNQGSSVTFNRFGMSLHLIAGNLRLSYGIHRTTFSGTGVEFPSSHMLSLGYDFGDEEDEYFRFF